MNVVVLQGKLSSAPRARALASGTELTAYEVTTRDAEGQADSVPVVWFASRGPELDEGDEVVVVGRVRRRFYQAGGATRSSTEVLAEAVVPARQRAKAKRAVDAAMRAASTAGQPEERA
jgi:single-strand DNA-binding protein